MFRCEFSWVIASLNEHIHCLQFTFYSLQSTWVCVPWFVFIWINLCASYALQSHVCWRTAYTNYFYTVFILWFAVSWHDRLKHCKLTTRNCAKERIFFCFSNIIRFSKFVPPVIWQSFNGTRYMTLAACTHAKYVFSSLQMVGWDRKNRSTSDLIEMLFYMRVKNIAMRRMQYAYIFVASTNFMYQNQCGSVCAFTIFVALSHAMGW